MAQIIYQIVTGTPNFTASIVPADAADQIQTALGVYSFDDLPGDNYTLTVVDSLGCISVINNIVPITTTTTSTTSEPTTTTTTTTEEITTTTTTTVICGDGYKYNVAFYACGSCEPAGDGQICNEYMLSNGKWYFDPYTGLIMHITGFVSCSCDYVNYHILDQVKKNSCGEVECITTTTTTTTEFVCNDILLNSGFEDWTGGNPDDWGNIGGIQEDIIIHTGLHSVLFGTINTLVYQTFNPLTACLRLDLWYNSNADDCAYWGIQRNSFAEYLQADGSWSGVNHAFLLSNTGSNWVNVVFEFTTYNIDHILFVGNNDECTSYFDDVKICDNCINPPTTTTTTTEEPTTTTTTTGAPTTTTTTTECVRPATIPLSLYHCIEPVGGGDCVNFTSSFEDAELAISLFCMSPPAYNLRGEEDGVTVGMIVGEIVYVLYIHTDCVLKLTGYYLYVNDGKPYSVVYIVDGIIQSITEVPCPTTTTTTTSS